MKKKTSSNKIELRDFVYLKWNYAIKDYFRSLMPQNFIFDLIYPLLLTCTIFIVAYYRKTPIFEFINNLSNGLFSLTAVFIGLSTLLITLLLTNNSKNIEFLQTKHTGLVIDKNSFTYFNLLLAQLTESLAAQILLMFTLLFVKLFEKPEPGIIGAISFFFIIIYLFIHILFTIIRAITNIYETFFHIQQ